MPADSSANTVPHSTSLTIPGPVGDLEVLIDEPHTEVATAAESISHVAVVCHPHPLFGGTMTNKVAHILARSFNELQAPAVRFNFRGVGKSGGQHDDGQGETQDVLAILRFSRERWPTASISLAGFSFGAAMALKAALHYPIARLITVAPALHWLAGLNGAVPSCPWLIVQGDRDAMVNAEAVQAWAASLAKPPCIVILPEAEHFFHGRLNDVRETVKNWVSAN